MKRNIYISGPMRGKPNLNIEAFALAAVEIKKRGDDCFCPPMFPTGEPRPIFKRDTAWICDNATGLFMLEGWQDSNGATMEYYLAKALGLEIEGAI